MKVFRSFVIAFSMYSRLPMPRFPWKEEDMSYVMAFFPLVGLVEGGLFYLWSCLYVRTGFGDGSLLFPAVSVLLPVLVSGGIHIDGFMDTVDALSSYRSREERLAILKDPHTGAFAVIWAILYFFLSAAAFSLFFPGGKGASLQPAILMGAGYVLSRVMSGFSAVHDGAARKDGTVALFGQAADRRVNEIILMIEGCLVLALSFYSCGWLLLVPLAANAVLLLIYRKKILPAFGGVTGDLCGFLSTTSELVTALSIGLAREAIWNFL